MDQVARLMKQPRTPETPREIASIISASQFTQAGPYNVSAEDFSSQLMGLATTARLPVMLFLIYSYTADRRFNPDQAVQLGLTSVERLGQPIQDPSRFVAMGGMPADDDEDVVFVREEIKPIEDAKKRMFEATKAFKKISSQTTVAAALSMTAQACREKAESAVFHAKAALDKAGKLEDKRVKKYDSMVDDVRRARIAKRKAEDELAKLVREEDNKKARND